ncbi:MAG: fibro-slime domain-containing protein [Phycisphaerales bacterium]
MKIKGAIAATVVAAGMTGIATADIVDVNMVIRDFATEHPDFQPDGVTGGVVTDVVEATLGADGKPVLNPERAALDFITSPETFAQWYKDVEDINVNLARAFQFDNTITADPRVYTYQDATFFPIDNEGFGNQGNSNNYHFTVELHTQFVYSGGDPITLRYRSDDDMWVFINGQRIIDLGGVRRAANAQFILDSTSAAALGLVVGETYDFDLFYTERRTREAEFFADILIPSPSAAVIGLMGLGALGTRRRRA